MNASREYPPHPLPGALAAVMRNGRLALVQRAKDPDRGLWGLPGGMVEEGESVEEAAARELWEETGIRATNGRIVHRFHVGQAGAKYHFHLHVVLLDWQEGEGVAASDALALGWYDRAEIEGLACSKTVPGVVDLLFGLGS